MAAGLIKSGIRLVLPTLRGVRLRLLLAISILLTYTLPFATVVLIRPVVEHIVIAALVAIAIAYLWAVLRTRNLQPLVRAGQPPR